MGCWPESRKKHRGVKVATCMIQTDIIPKDTHTGELFSQIL